MSEKQRNITEVKIWDKPTANDEFGRSSFVDVIFNTITTSDESFNLGISARWGEGKSSILQQLQPRLEKANYKVLRFEPWKYTQDQISIKRKFLIDIYRQLGKNFNEELFYAEQEVENELDDEAKEGKFFKFLEDFIFYFFWAVVIFLFVLVFFKYIIFPGADISISKIFMESLLIPAIAGLIPFLQKISEIKVKQTVPKIESAEQFEDLFKSVITEITEADKSIKKIIIFIDDLDRCNYKEVEQVMTALFTFFNNPNCIYVITADHVVIRRYISDFLYLKEDGNTTESPEDLRKKKDREATEYLKKIFQINFIVPKVSFEKLNPWIDKLLKREKFTYQNQFGEENLKDLIRTQFERNPRKIKHFVRTLSFQIQIVEEKMKDAEQAELESLQDIKNYPELLAKVLVIQDRFPEFYDLISSAPKLIKAYELGQESPKDEEIKNFLLQEPRFYNSAFREEKDKDVDPYIFLYISGATGFENVNIVDPSQILEFARNANIDELLKVFSGLTDKPIYKETQQLINELDKSGTTENNLHRSIFHLLPLIQKEDTRTSLTEKFINITVKRAPTQSTEIASLQAYDFSSFVKKLKSPILDIFFTPGSPYIAVKNQIYQAFIDLQNEMEAEISEYFIQKLADDIKGSVEEYNIAMPHLKNLKEDSLKKSTALQESIINDFTTAGNPVKKDYLNLLTEGKEIIDKKLIGKLQKDINELVKRADTADNVFILSELSGGMSKIVDRDNFTESLIERLIVINSGDFPTLIDNAMAGHVKSALGDENYFKIAKAIIGQINSTDEGKRGVLVSRITDMLKTDLLRMNEIVEIILKNILIKQDANDDMILNILNTTKDIWTIKIIPSKAVKDSLFKIEKEATVGSIKSNSTAIIDFLKIRPQTSIKFQKLNRNN